MSVMRTAYVNVLPKTDGFDSSLKRKLRAIDASKDGKRIGSSLGDAMGKGFNEKGSIFLKTAATMASKLTIVGAAASAAAPGVVHLTAALVPAAGALVALPAAMGAVKLAAGTFKVATAGVGDAISTGLTGTSEQAKKAMEDLPPAARRFTASIVALKPQINALKASVAGRFFKPLQDEVGPLASKYLPMLKAQMSNLAGPLGGLGESIAKSAGKAKVFNAVQSLFYNTRIAVINLRAAIGPVIDAFASLGLATGPLLPRISQGFADLAIKVANFITVASRSGQVREVFDGAVTTIKTLIEIVRNVGSIFASVFSAATISGGNLLTNIRELTGQVATFLQSAKGSAALTAVFGTLAGLGASLRDGLGKVLPVLADAFITLAPVVSGVAGPAITLLTAFTPLVPVVASLAAKLITTLTPALTSVGTFLTQNVGAVKGLAIALVSFKAIMIAGAIATQIQGAGSLRAYLKGTQLAMAATKAWTGIQAIFNLVMEANPIGIAVVAIAALVAGVVIAYQKSDKFRAVVQAAWAGIKVAVGATVDWFTSTVWPVLKRVWDGIAAGAMWLWKNVIQPAWTGIQTAVQAAVIVVTGILKGLKAVFDNVIAPVVTWLWKNVFKPAFDGISFIVRNTIAAVQIVFGVLKFVIEKTLGPVVMALWRNVFKPAWEGIKAAVAVAWALIKVSLAAFRAFITGVVAPTVKWLYTTIFKPMFDAIGRVVSTVWNNVIKPVWTALRTAFQATGNALRAVWDKVIKPMFTALSGFITNKVAPGFRNGVTAIGAAWEKLKATAKKPIAFVVNKLINPFIGGINKAAEIVGVKARLTPIPGFAEGGRIKGRKVPGYADGGRISGAPSSVDNRLAPATIPGMGAVKLAGGEFVVNARDTSKALPLLRWVNDGMKGGPGKVRSYLGKRLADRPGDGSEGWAFKDGGLVGWTKDLWGALSNPASLIKKPFEAMIGKAPGSGMLKDILIGGGRKLLDGAINFISSFGGAGHGSLATGIMGGKVGQAQRFVQAQAGKPYVWASAGPNGYDCSGIVSAAYNVLKGKNPYNHTFSTGSMPGGFVKPGMNGPLLIGWSHPGQAPAGSSVGHMAGQIGGLPFESTGSRGVHIGASARRVTQFAHVGAAGFARGGVLPFGSYDAGGFLPTGVSLAHNGTGKPEPVGHKLGGSTYNITVNVPTGAHPAQAGAAIVEAIKAFERSSGNRWRTA